MLKHGKTRNFGKIGDQLRDYNSFNLEKPSNLDINTYSGANLILENIANNLNTQENEDDFLPLIDPDGRNEKEKQKKFGTNIAILLKESEPGAKLSNMLDKTVNTI